MENLVQTHFKFRFPRTHHQHKGVTKAIENTVDIIILKVILGHIFAVTSQYFVTADQRMSIKIKQMVGSKTAEVVVSMFENKLQGYLIDVVASFRAVPFGHLVHFLHKLTSISDHEASLDHFI